jgi:ABC-2 type transport system permease protein
VSATSIRNGVAAGGLAALDRSRVGEFRKLAAFCRRDLLIAWSYRLAFLSDAVMLVVQAFVFSLVGKLVDPAQMPTYGGVRATYMAFVATGIALGAFVQIGLNRLATVIHQEQMTGTLESLLMTPTEPTTVQLGSAVYDLLYVPIRTAVFLAAVGLVFGLHFQASGVVPSLLILLLFIPFVWGLGVLSAAGMLTFRRGGSAVGFIGAALTIGSGAYFPLHVLPGWLQAIARLNPMSTAVDGLRQALLGGAGWGHTGRILLELAPASAVTLGLGMVAFRLALKRERRRGTLGLY